MSGRGAVQSIDARTAAARLVADDPAPLLIDVRETIEFAGGRAAEAVTEAAQCGPDATGDRATPSSGRCSRWIRQRFRRH